MKNKLKLLEGEAIKKGSTSVSLMLCLKSPKVIPIKIIYSFTIMLSPTFTEPPFITLVKIPSRGIMQSPTA